MRTCDLPDSSIECAIVNDGMCFVSQLNSTFATLVLTTNGPMKHGRTTKWIASNHIMRPMKLRVVQCNDGVREIKWPTANKLCLRNLDCRMLCQYSWQVVRLMIAPDIDKLIVSERGNRGSERKCSSIVTESAKSEFGRHMFTCEHQGVPGKHVRYFCIMKGHINRGVHRAANHSDTSHERLMLR